VLLVGGEEYRERFISVDRGAFLVMAIELEQLSEGKLIAPGIPRRPEQSDIHGITAVGKMIRLNEIER
jgi:hypothetical protein